MHKARSHFVNGSAQQGAARYQTRMGNILGSLTREPGLYLLFVALDGAHRYSYARSALSAGTSPLKALPGSWRH